MFSILHPSRPSSGRILATPRTTALALSIALGASFVTSVISAAPASAHAKLVKIAPAANAQLTTAPKQVSLEFSEPINPEFVTVVVTTAAGGSVAQGKAAVSGTRVSQNLRPGISSDAYRIAFQVTSDDGHPITGQSSFTLKLAPGMSPAPSAAATSSPGPTAPTLPVPTTAPVESSGSGQNSLIGEYLVPVSGTALLLVIGTGVLLWERRRP